MLLPRLGNHYLVRSSRHPASEWDPTRKTQEPEHPCSAGWLSSGRVGNGCAVDTPDGVLYPVEKARVDCWAGECEELKRHRGLWLFLSFVYLKELQS